LAEKVADVLEFRKVEEINTLTMQELGVEPVSLSKIRSILKNAGFDIAAKDLLPLTLSKISSLLGGN